MHNSVLIDSPFHPEGKYNTTSRNELSEDGGYLVTSNLYINSLNAFDSGNVTCMVMAMADSEIDEEIPPVSHTSQLSVLGKYAKNI